MLKFAINPELQQRIKSFSTFLKGGVNKMENQSKMQLGTWGRISTENLEAKDKVRFEVNITQRVVILNPTPKELTGEDGGAYYVFEVEQDKKPKILQTSAWTLLKELKRANLKAGTILDITKKLKAGKQFFEVVEVKQ